MPDTGPGSANFEVDLAALEDAIGKITMEHDGMGNDIVSLMSTFTNIQNHWHSPAADSFHDLVTQFNTASGNLELLLGEAIDKMNSAYQNYLATEETNTKNYQQMTATGNGGNQPPQGGDGGDQPPQGGDGGDQPAQGGKPSGGKPSGSIPLS
ncbi:hypothetical protein GCM10023322_76230 [Rugosimonospora acidiphila]|uniref:WXG100 family type VII secretion target n=1 Tax=Rugosimonospora acidiphila TaxID=556531 RepID=A0ABP9SNQ6_9ACTN